MNKFPSHLWSIEPSAMNALLAQMQSLLMAGKLMPQMEAKEEVFAGPASDGERAGLPMRVFGNVAVISTCGPMIKGSGYYCFASTSATRRAILSAGADDDIETILWRMDTPGGSVDGMAECQDAVRQVEKNKRIIVQVDGMLASAGIYVSAFATEIRAGRMDVIGSIGTRMLIYDWSKAFEQAGIRAIPIDTGEFKSAGALGTEITEAQVADFQRIVNDYFDDFRATLMKGRKLNAKQFGAVSDGRVWLTADALNLGLVDKVSTFDATLAELMGSKKGRSTSSARARLRMQQ